MKQSHALVGIAALLLLVGAGCSQGENPQVKDATPAADATAPTETNSSDIVTAPEVSPDTNSSQTSSDFTVTAEAKGNRTLNVTWSVPSSMSEDKDVSAYRILVGKTENPTWDNKYYWYERGATYRDKTIEGLNTGKQHIRVCAVKAGDCAMYSNNVTVDVK